MKWLIISLLVSLGCTTHPIDTGEINRQVEKSLHVQHSVTVNVVFGEYADIARYHKALYGTTTTLPGFYCMKNSTVYCIRNKTVATHEITHGITTKLYPMLPPYIHEILAWHVVNDMR